MGLTPRGQGARAIKEGWTQKDGKLPVNPSGGLKAKGHPIGATGVSMHVMSAMQLVGQAPEGMQLKNAKLAGIFNMGGAAVANYVSRAGAGEVDRRERLGGQRCACAVPTVTLWSASDLLENAS